MAIVIDGVTLPDLPEGLITEDAALNASSNRGELQQMIRGVFHGTRG